MTDEQTGSGALEAYLADRMAAAALRTWALERNMIISVPKTPWRRRGGTGAQLASVDLFPYPKEGIDSYRQSVIVKVCAKGDYSLEPQLHKQAWEARPEFSKRHLVEQPHDPLALPDGRSVMFQEVNFDLGLACTLGELPDSYQAAGCRRAFSLILQEWNCPHEIRQKTLDVGEYLRLELRHAMSPGRSAYEWAKDAHLLHSDGFLSPAITQDSLNDLPNPIRMATENFPAKGTRITYFSGLSHGDLHLDNLVIARTPEGNPELDTMQFIDLSGFTERAPLARDIVTLTLSCVFRILRTGPSEAQKEELIRFLVDGVADSRPVLPEPLRDTLTETVQVRSLFSHSQGLWPAQYLLSLLAQALIYTSYENVEETGRRWFFYLAARAAKSFISLR